MNNALNSALSTGRLVRHDVQDDDRCVATSRPDDAWRPIGGVAALLVANLAEPAGRRTAAAWAAE